MDGKQSIIDLAVPLLMRFEGFAAEPYRCPAGKWTVGYGHVIPAPDAIPHLLLSQADALLQEDLRRFMTGLRRQTPCTLQPHQWAALLCFCFNVGLAAYQRSTLRRKVLREEHADVSEEFLRWVWAGGHKLQGLLRRREAEAALYLGVFLP